MNGTTEVQVSRKDHVQWCKDRAKEVLKTGGSITGAWTSMVSDLQKHPETVGHPGILLGMAQIVSGLIKTPEQLQTFINGFN